jgi:hypothetical protein
MPHSIIIPGDACLAYFNKIWGILPPRHSAWKCLLALADEVIE